MPPSQWNLMMPPPADGVTEKADQPVMDKQDDEPDPVEAESTEIQVRVRSPTSAYGLRRQPRPSRKMRESNKLWTSFPKGGRDVTLYNLYCNILTPCLSV